MTITAAAAAERLDRLPGRRFAPDETSTACRIVEALEQSRCIPMPGAHTPRLRQLRSACRRAGQMPSLPRRAAVVLGLIGRVDAEGRVPDRWSLRHWRPVVREWFESAMDATEPVPERTRPRLMLMALYLLAAEDEPAAIDLAAAFDQALARIAEPHREPLPLSMPAGFDPAAAGTDEQWRHAVECLRSPAARPRVAALFFVHALHAVLDSRQPDPQRVSRLALEHLYAEVIEVLRQQSTSGGCLREAAAGLLAGLPLLGPFSAVAPPPFEPGLEALPACFGAYDARSGVLPWRHVRECLEAAGGHHLLEAERALAEAAGERVIDVLRIDAANAYRERYGWLESCSRRRFGPSRHWNLFNRIRHADLVDEVQALAGATPVHAAPAACALCGS